MESPKRNLISSILFKAICLSGAIATAIWCCYEYNKNEDMCEVYFKRFLEDEWSIYPDITISIPHQLNEEALKQTFGGQINSSSYRKTLQGVAWDYRILQVPIDTLTLNVDDYLINTRIEINTFQLVQKFSFTQVCSDFCSNRPHSDSWMIVSIF